MINSLAKNVEDISEELFEIYVNFVILRNGEIMIIPEFWGKMICISDLLSLFIRLAIYFLELYKLILLLIMNITYLSSFH